MTMAVRSGFRQFFKTKNMTSYGTSSWFIGTSIARCWLVVWNIFFSIQFGIIIPTDYIIFFRGVGIPPSRVENTRVQPPTSKMKLDVPLTSLQDTSQLSEQRVDSVCESGHVDPQKS